MEKQLEFSVKKTSLFGRNIHSDNGGYEVYQCGCGWLDTFDEANEFKNRYQLQDSSICTTYDIICREKL